MVAVWNSFYSGDDEGQTICLRIFDRTGAALGEEVVVSSTGSDTQFAPADVVELADGRILVSYSSLEIGLTEAAPIRGRVFDADGTALGSDFILTDDSEIFSGVPAMTVLSDGRLLATWKTEGAITEDDDGNLQLEPGVIRGRRLDVDGQPLGDSFAISTTLSDIGPGGPAVVALPGGGAFVAWYSGDPGDGDWGCLRGRLIDANGRPLGTDMVLNSTPFNIDSNPSLAVAPDGRVLATWSDEGDLGADAVTRGLWITPAVGHAGDDTLSGSTGHDMIMGLGGADVISTGQGEDMQMGGSGRDSLAGGAGDDQIMGQSGADVVRAGRGDDMVNGGWGADRLFGGLGEDTFCFDARSGHDVILDFAEGDRLQIAAALWEHRGETAQDLIDYHATVTGDGVMIQFGSFNHILLAGVMTTAGLADAIDLM